MSLSNDSNGNGSNGDGDDARFYVAENDPIGDVQPGEVIRLRPEVAEAYEDNLTELDAENEEEARDAAEQHVEEQGGATTVRTQDHDDFDPEAGTFRVLHAPLGTAEPGDTVELSENVARAYADNLAVAGSEEDPETDSDDDEDVDAEDVEADVEDPSPESSAAGADPEFDSPEDFLNQNVSEVKASLASYDLSDDELDALYDAEQEGSDRKTVKQAIEDQRSD